MTRIRAKSWVVTPSVDLPVDLPYVRDQHLRCVNGSVEDRYIEQLIRVAVMQGEQFTQRAWMPQTRILVLDHFPDEIDVPAPPLISVTSLGYLDGAGVLQPLLEGTDFTVVAPQGPFAGPGVIRLSAGGTWPTPQVGPFNAVQLTYQAGYVDNTSPAQPDVPAALTQGALLLIGELYKVRSVSVHTINQNPALVNHEALWTPFKVYDVLHRYGNWSTDWTPPVSSTPGWWGL